MILPLPFWFICIVIAITKVILSGTIGAVLVFYVKHSHDPYANSIRWSRVGGVLETVPLLWNSRREVSRRSCFNMSAMIVANILTLFVSIFLGKSVSRADVAGERNTAGITTGQLPPTIPLAWTDWNAFMESDATMEDTMDLLLNDTRFNPKPDLRTVYTPRKYNYEITCNETEVVIGNSKRNVPFQFPSSLHNCKLVSLLILSRENFQWDTKTASSQLVTPDVHMVVAPIFYKKHIYNELDAYVSTNNGRFCFRFPQAVSSFNSFPKDGMTSLPQTDATRCQYGSDDSLILAVTSIKFAVNRFDDFEKVMTLVFDSPSSLPLLQTMHNVIDSGIFLNPINNGTLVMLTRVSNNVDFLVCASINFDQISIKGLVCTYFVVVTITAKPQQWDSIIPEVLNPRLKAPYDAITTTNQNEINIHHMPSGTRNSTDTFSAAHLLKATTDATVYLASLGHDVVMNQTTEQLYILFYTVQLKDAFEISNTLLIVMGAITVVCVVVWGLSEKLYEPVFNGSLYKVIYKEIEAKGEVVSKENIKPDEDIKPDEEIEPIEETKPIEVTKTPMLMDCTHDPLAFEGYQVIPHMNEHSVQSSQDQGHAMIAITEQSPAQQMLMQQTPTLEEIIAPITITVSASSSEQPEAALLSSLSVSPTIPLSPPPCPLDRHRNLARATSTLVLPPLHTGTGHSSQYTPFLST